MDSPDANPSRGLPRKWRRWPARRLRGRAFGLWLVAAPSASASGARLGGIRAATLGPRVRAETERLVGPGGRLRTPAELRLVAAGQPNR